MSSLILQSTPTYILNLIVNGFALGGIVGILIGSIAWTASERGGRSLMTMMFGAIAGLILGFIIAGTGVLDQFGSLESVLSNANRTTSATLDAIMQIIFFVLLGTAVGGAISALGRALSGAFIGLVAGTLAGVLLLLLNGQFGLAIIGPTATIIVGILTLIIVGVMGVGQAGR